jgi:preprotein translocase subunit SecD
MSRSWWGRCFFLGASIVLAGFCLYPTLARLDLQTTRFPWKQKMNLGLDLQGGVYLVLGVDFHKVYRDVLLRQASSLKEKLLENREKISEKREKDSDKKMPRSPQVGSVMGTGEDPRIFVSFDPDQREDFHRLLKKEFWSLRLAGEKSGQFELGLSHDYRSEVKDKTVNQSIEVIRNRIDEFGVTEPLITRQGTDRVVVELPGVKEIDRAKELIGRTAQLEFKVVDDQKMRELDLPQMIAQVEKERQLSSQGQKFSEYLKKLNDFMRSRIPQADEVAFDRGQSGEISKTPYLLIAKAEVTGRDLQDASVQMDPETHQPYVSFVLNPHGATQFEKLTGDHVGGRLAIVLDGVVHSAPVIQTRIGGGKGQITLGRGDGDLMLKEAKDLAIVLRAGALPAQLDFLEQRIVGPSLGGDSIQKGAMASLVGSLVVFIFVGIYYRVSGLIAVFSLLLNVLFVLASLVILEATLTLPGIAGIALTVGIAVDSNVVIYERIREELRLGKMARHAVELGFQKAFRTILDANVTNAFAAIVLLMYGTGPIKGFAVTLLIGIVTTLFTAVFVCRLIFDLYLSRLERRSGSLSI